MKKFFSLALAVCASVMLFAADLYKADFTTDQAGWTIDNKELGDGLTWVWKLDTYNGSSYMKASAYVGSAKAAESWLISPEIDLTAAKKATIKLNQAVNKGAATNLKLKVSADKGATWNDITIGMPAGTSWTFQDDEAVIDEYAGKNIQLALVYVSTTSVCPTWEVKTVTIYEGESDNPSIEAEEISMADAITLCEGMADNTYSEKTYRVEGIVTLAYEYSDQYKNQSFYFGAEAGAQKGSTLEVYRGVPAAPGVAEGDKIAVTGKLGVRTTSKGDRSIGFQAGATVEKINNTAINNTTVAEKAVKMIENGQLVIIRNGVKFNAVGAVVE